MILCHVITGEITELVAVFCVKYFIADWHEQCYDECIELIATSYRFLFHLCIYVLNCQFFVSLEIVNIKPGKDNNYVLEK